MFEDPPAWTAPIANLTAWFDWEALSAIGTVGALWYAVTQGFRSARFERMRAASAITRVLELVGPVNNGCVIDDDGFLVSDHAQLLVTEGYLQRAIVGLDTVSLAEVPDVGAVSYVEVLKTALPRLKDSLEGVVSGLFPPHFDDEARTIAEAYDYLALLKQIYLTGSLSAQWEMRRRF